MLPAKFRGFASRVGRLASRALAWRKTSERDSAARTSRTLLRALFAMILAAATLLAMLVLQPVNRANAAGKANVFWDYIGTGYISPSSVDNHDIWRDIDFKNPVIKTENVNGRKKTTITWEVLYNKEACRIKAMENPLLKCDPKDGSHSYDGQPEFYAVLPSGVKDETVRITRYRTEFDKTGSYQGHFGVKFYSWHLRGNENEEPGKFNSGTNVTRIPGDPEYDELWNQHIATCGIFSNEACEAWNWKQQGKFGRLFKTWEQNNSVSGIRWIISAEVKDNQDPYNLPFMAGFVSYRNGSDKNKFIIWGPYDHDGDGIPDSKEWHYGFNPTSNDDIQFPKKSKKDAVYGEITDVDPYFKVGHWEGTAEQGSWKYDNTEKPFEQTDTGITFSFKKSGGKEILPNGVTKASNPNNMQPGQAYIDPITGKLKYNPKKTDRGHTIHFDVQITYPNPSANSCKYKKQVEQVKRVDINIVSQASVYNPNYDTTVVKYDKNTKNFNSTDSAEPKSVAKSGKPWIRTGNLPKGTKFELKQYTMKIGNSTNTRGDGLLTWSSISKKSPDNTGNGKVTFKPNKSNAGESNHTPVLVTYPDGSTSEDTDAGNDGVVYAPVKVDDLQVTDGDLHLDFKDGTQINNGQFGGWSFGDANKPKELSKSTKIGAPTKKDSKPRNGIVLDSWSTNAKGPITFRAVCHKKNDFNYKLLKPAEGKNKASGDINGLQFEEFRQWIRDNDKKCKVKGANCSDDNHYLHPGEYNNDTMERSRALIGGKPKEGGEYECKVFAFHQAHDGKGTQHNQALTQFDTLAKNNGAGFAFAFDTGAFASSKGKEWVSGNFYFKIKLKDNQKYNPTYVKIPEIKAGTFANKEYNSSDQPKSHKKITVDGKQVNANGVPDDDLGGVEDNKDLPKGTWFSIKKLVKKVDKTQPDKFPTEELWSNFEGGEDNVKRDNSGKPVMEKGKVVPLNETGREYGSVTFRPDKWKDAGQYWAEVVVHYPDGSTSDGEGSINKDHPIYAKVNVTRDDAHNQFGLALYKNYPNTLMDNGYDLKVDKSLPNDATFDSWLTKSVGPIHLHMICSKKAKEGNSGTKTKQTEYTYNRLPGHDETNGLRLKKQTIWGHATFEQQKSCIKNRDNCKPDTLLYDDWVPGGNSNNTAERTRGFFGGKAQKTGDYVCKVYAIKGDQKKSDAFKKAVEANIEKNKKDKKDVDPVPSVLNAKGNPYGTEGVGYKTGSFEVRIHNDNQLYNPTYTTIPEIEAGSTYNAKKAAISSGAPQSKKKVTEGSADVNANGVSDYDLQNVKEGALPAGTWYEIKRFVKAGDISKTSAKSLPWANFEDGEDNKADGRQEAKDSNATGKGSVTFRPDKWQDADDYWAEIRVHYPDGSVSDSEDSINYKHPIYAKVKVTRPTIDKGDLHLNVYKQYENGKFTGYVDDVNGITVMKGVGLLKDMGIDSWSTAKPEGITLRALCRDDSDEAKKSTTHIWSENLDNLFFKLNWQKSWDHADFQKQEACRKGSNNGDGCNPEGKYLLFDSTGGTMERASGTITSDKAPTKSGKYYCVVLAMKLTDLGKYKKAIKNSKISVTNNNFAKAMGFTDTEGIDWTAKYFPVTVVEKFSLPKTGGDGLSMALLVVAMIGMCVMCGAFFVDQTKWGHAMLVGAAGAAVSAAAGMMRGLRGATQNSNSNRNSKISEIWRGLVKKVKDIRRFDDYSASVKDFVRKATGWLRAALRRVGRWAAERWRC